MLMGCKKGISQIQKDIESNLEASKEIASISETTVGKCSFSELGQEAINSFIRESPDLILMDIRVAGDDGIQATEKIRTISLTVPIIAADIHTDFTSNSHGSSGCGNTRSDRVCIQGHLPRSHDTVHDEAERRRRSPRS